MSFQKSYSIQQFEKLGFKMKKLSFGKREVFFSLVCGLILVIFSQVPRLTAPTKVLYKDSAEFYNPRSPLAKFRLSHSARLVQKQLVADIRLDSAFDNSNGSELIPYGYLGENQNAYGDIIGIIHASMLSALGPWNFPDKKNIQSRKHLAKKLSQEAFYWNSIPYFKNVPEKQGQAFRQFLRQEAFLSYKVFIYNGDVCNDSRRQSHRDYDYKTEVLERFLPIPKAASKNNFSLEMMPLFEKTLRISNWIYPRCEHAESTIVHIPRAPEPKVVTEPTNKDAGFKDYLYAAWKFVAYGQTNPPKYRATCFASTKILNDFEKRHVPDVMVSVLFCY